MTQQGIEAGLAALRGFEAVLRDALLSEDPVAEVTAQMADVEAGLAAIAAQAAGQGRLEASARFDALSAALACIAAHLARGDRRAALEALAAGSFPRALRALEDHFAPPGALSPPEAGAAEAAA